VAAEPAAFVVFDLLARNGKDLRERPYWKRRRKLEKLSGAPSFSDWRSTRIIQRESEGACLGIDGSSPRSSKMKP
jgi:ATP-dependent DNA ligase